MLAAQMGPTTSMTSPPTACYRCLLHTPMLLLLLCAITSPASSTRTLQATSPPSNPLPQIAIVTTGGTILSIPDENGNLIPAANATQLVQAVPGLNKVANITGIYAADNIDSSDATPAFWIRVAGNVSIQLKDPNVDAVIVLHGTDSMEQTAMFLQCIDKIGASSKPVVMTGAMQGASSPFADGPQNILSAAVVAASSQASGLGVLVVFAEQVFSARYVTKVSANARDAFGGIDDGAKIGDIVEQRLILHFRPVGKLLCAGGFPLPSKLPKVALQPAYPGVDGRVLEWYKKKGFIGALVEGLGSGNIGSSLGAAVSGLVAPGNGTKFHVVVARKPANGVTAPDYGCSGCLGTLLKQGVVQALNLDAFQARIVLMLALAKNDKVKPETLQAVYDKITYNVAK